MWVNQVRLPSEYQEVEYIQSSGTQVLRIGSSWSAGYKTIADLQITGTADVLYGERDSSYSQRYGVWYSPSSSGYFGGCSGGTSISNTTKSVDQNRHIFILDNGTLSIDGVSYSVSNGSKTFGRGLVIFGYCGEENNSYYGFSSMKLFSFKAYNGSTLLYDLVPCYRKSDSVIGMYDLVNSVFYTNQGTGTFTKGSDISTPTLKEYQVRPASKLPSTYQEVEYIQSSATSPGSTSSSGQCINTGFTHTPNTKVEIDFQYSSTTVQQRMFGSETTNSSYSTFTTYINGSGQWARATKDGEGNWQSTSVTADTNRHTFVLDKSTYKIYTNGTQIHSGSNAYTITKNGQYPLTLFATRHTNYNSYIEHASAKLYSCKIYESSTLVRDFVPCYRKSDNVIGLWDNVGKQFYTNAGSGTFTKGPNV